MKSALVFLVCLVNTTIAFTAQETTATFPTETTAAAASCGITDYFGPTGIISSPNYPFYYYNYLYCDYYIRATSKSSLSLIFKSFDLEYNYDYVTISCPNNGSFSTLQYTGHVLPKPVSIPWCSLGLVRLQTDNIVVDLGFSLDYYVSEGGCGETVYTGDSGYVTSPNHPDSYGYNQNCSNIIWAPASSTFYLQFRNFSLQSPCYTDWVDIRCLDNSANQPLRTCGYFGYTEWYIYDCSQVLLWFHSDGANSYTGFNIQYTVFPNENVTDSSNTSLPAAITTAPGDQLCGNSYFSDSYGVIRSPNYPGFYYNYLDCDYNVYASTGSSLAFVFKSFHVENGDFVTISCPPNSNFPPQAFSGHYVPDPVAAPVCSQGLINFHTDYTNVSSGFSIDYYVNTAGCGNTVSVGDYGFLTSPFWPDSYGYNQNCSNIVWAPQQGTIHLQFNFFSLEDDCSSDWLEVSCLDNSQYGPRRYCGNNNDYELFLYQCSQVLLWFHSDDSGNYPGYSIAYIVYQDADCGDNSYYDPSGVISSPNFPVNYLNFLYCDYTIYAPTGNSITLIFTSFSVEENYDFVTVSCSSNSSYPKQEFTGYNLPSPISISDCSQGLVNFHTDFSVTTSGFSLNYYVNTGGCGNTLYYPSSGSVTSPNWPSNYGYNQNCSNIIHAGAESTIYLSVQSFILQSCCTCDWLEISCIDNPEYGPTRYCGAYAPVDTYIYNCSQILLWFHSDGSSNDQGFNIGYTVFTDVDDSKVPPNKKPIEEKNRPSKKQANAPGKKAINRTPNAEKDASNIEKPAINGKPNTEDKN